MEILLGACSDNSKRIIAYKENGFGRMTVNKKITPYLGEKWGLDNGAFVCWKKGLPFDSDKFLAMVDYAAKQIPPYMAILPDIVTKGDESLDFSLSWIDRLPSWNWYLAVQDGMDSAKVIENIYKFSGLFLGGSDQFKKTALYWRRIAHVHKKKFHYGRAGTYRKLQHAYDVGADSLDSAFPLWTKPRFEEFIQWIKRKPWNQRLFSLNELHQEY